MFNLKDEFFQYIHSFSLFAKINLAIFGKPEPQRKWNLIGRKKIKVLLLLFFHRTPETMWEALRTQECWEFWSERVRQKNLFLQLIVIPAPGSVILPVLPETDQKSSSPLMSSLNCSSPVVLRIQIACAQSGKTSWLRSGSSLPPSQSWCNDTLLVKAKRRWEMAHR